jgi:hypothetical protein
MGQEKPRRSIQPTFCPLDGVVQCAGFWIIVPHHLVVLNDQIDVILTGSPEPLFQPQALVASFHMTASGTLNKFRVPEHILEGNRVVPPFPRNADLSHESCGMLGKIMKHSASGNPY